MNNFDSFDRKSFRKAKFEAKKKSKKGVNQSQNIEEFRLSRISKQNIKKKIQEIQEEEKWEDWEDEIS
jgi:hypothetical protein